VNDNPNPNPNLITPTTQAGALASASLTALVTMLNGVNTATIISRSGLPLLLFKSRDDGTWSYGVERYVVEEGSLWAVNFLTLRHGWVCFASPEEKKILGEVMVPANEPKPDYTTLPNLGRPWQEQLSVELKCATGQDTGVEVLPKMSTTGGLQALAGLVVAVRNRANGGQHNGDLVPIVSLDRDSYPHKKHGRVWFPLMTIRQWMSPENKAPPPPPTPTPPSSPAPANDRAPPEPRRRRVA
jgi:hypothetical protein